MQLQQLQQHTAPPRQGGRVGECLACGHFRPHGVRHCARCLSQITADQGPVLPTGSRVGAEGFFAGLGEGVGGPTLPLEGTDGPSTIKNQMDELVRGLHKPPPADGRPSLIGPISTISPAPDILSGTPNDNGPGCLIDCESARWYSPSPVSGDDEYTWDAGASAFWDADMPTFFRDDSGLLELKATDCIEDRMQTLSLVPSDEADTTRAEDRAISSKTVVGNGYDLLRRYGRAYLNLWVMKDKDGCPLGCPLKGMCGKARAIKSKVRAQVLKSALYFVRGGKRGDCVEPLVVTQ